MFGYASKLARKFGAARRVNQAPEPTVIRCGQPWALDLQARNGIRFDAVPELVFDEVLARVAAIPE